MLFVDIKYFVAQAHAQVYKGASMSTCMTSFVDCVIEFLLHNRVTRRQRPSNRIVFMEHDVE